MVQRLKKTSDSPKKRKKKYKGEVAQAKRMREEVLAEVDKEARREKKEKVIFEEADFEKLDKTDKDKRLIMWSGVVFFMILALAGWIWGMKKILKENRLENSGQEVDWIKMTEDFSKSIEEMKEGLSQLKSLENGAVDSSGLSGTKTVSTSTAENAATSSSTILREGGTLPISEDAIQELKGELENNNN